jgi:hypothetical protein
MCKMVRIWFDRCVGERVPHNVRLSIGGKESGVTLDVQLKSWDDDQWWLRLGVFCWGPYIYETGRFALLGNLIQVRASRRTCSNGWGCGFSFGK